MSLLAAILNLVQRRLRRRAERHPELADDCRQRIEALERMKTTLRRR